MPPAPTHGGKEGGRPLAGAGKGGKRGSTYFDGECLLCHQLGHKAVQCPQRVQSGSMGARAGAFAAFNMGYAESSQAVAAGFHGTGVGPQTGHLFPAFCGFAIENYMSVAILDGGASLSAGGFKVLQFIVDRIDTMGTKADILPATASFTFAGRADTASKTKIALPLESMDCAALEVQCLPTEQTLLLIGKDMLDK